MVASGVGAAAAAEEEKDEDEDEDEDEEDEEDEEEDEPATGRGQTAECAPLSMAGDSKRRAAPRNSRPRDLFAGAAQELQPRGGLAASSLSLSLSPLRQKK